MDIEHVFKYHPPKPGQPEHYEAIRAAGRVFAQAILDNSPPNNDQGIAMIKVREAVMFANAAIALDVDPFEGDTFLAWDNPRTNSPCRALRVIGVKCVDLAQEAWDCWKQSTQEDGVDIEQAAERLRALGLAVEIVIADD